MGEQEEKLEPRARKSEKISCDIEWAMKSFDDALPDSEPALIPGGIRPGNSGHYGIRPGKG